MDEIMQCRDEKKLYELKKIYTARCVYMCSASVNVQLLYTIVGAIWWLAEVEWHLFVRGRYWAAKWISNQLNLDVWNRKQVNKSINNDSLNK